MYFPQNHLFASGAAAKFFGFISIFPDFVTKSSIIYPAHITKNPALIEKNASVNLNNVGLPVFLNPINDIMPIESPTKNPIKFSIFSNRNSNDD